jgi:hypothetical protein
MNLKGHKGKKEEEREERMKITYLKKGLVMEHGRADERRKETYKICPTTIKYYKQKERGREKIITVYIFILI